MEKIKMIKQNETIESYHFFPTVLHANYAEEEMKLPPFVFQSL